MKTGKRYYNRFSLFSNFHVDFYHPEFHNIKQFYSLIQYMSKSFEMKRNVFSLFVIIMLCITPMRAMIWANLTQKPPQTAIQISLPNSNSVWMSPGKIKLEWDTKNISSNKTIQFYLVKEDMVVQELGIFENNKFIDNVNLDGGLAEGDNYSVMGIELFPDDKYSIAKFATSFFTIKKAPRKEKMIAKTEENKVVQKADDKPLVREVFDGRNLNYIDEIKVYSENIKINLRDHGRADGDIVSIYLNGEAIVSKHLLTYRNRTFDVKLDATKPNDLFLYAHNLGKSPPNTVAIEIKDGAVSEKIILNSDMKKCEAIMIRVGGNNDSTSEK